MRNGLGEKEAEALVIGNQIENLMIKTGKIETTETMIKIEMTKNIKNAEEVEVEIEVIETMIKNVEEVGVEIVMTETMIRNAEEVEVETAIVTMRNVPERSLPILRLLENEGLKRLTLKKKRRRKKLLRK